MHKSLDLSNESSPFAALERRLHDHQHSLLTDLIGHLERVRELVSAATTAAATTAAVAAVEASSPSKGLPFEEAVGWAAEAVAAGLGATYVRTANSGGSLKGSKKGDGVLEIAPAIPDARVARVVLEFTTGGSRNWLEYLDLAERNREAQASLGVVPTCDLVPGAKLLALLSPWRLVLAFNPAVDDPSLFRCALQLLSVQAQRRLADGRLGDVGAADAKLTEAAATLEVMQDLLKTAVTVRNGAGKLVDGLEAIRVSLNLSIDQHGPLVGAPPRAA